MSYGTPPPPQQPYGQQPYGQVPPAQGSSGMAIGSLVCGILGFLCCWSVFLVSIVAVVLGLLALRTPGQPGKGMAISGLVLGALGILGGLVYWILVIVGVVHGGFHYSTTS